MPNIFALHREVVSCTGCCEEGFSVCMPEQRHVHQSFLASSSGEEGGRWSCRLLRERVRGLRIPVPWAYDLWAIKVRCGCQCCDSADFHINEHRQEDAGTLQCFPSWTCPLAGTGFNFSMFVGALQISSQAKPLTPA